MAYRGFGRLDVGRLRFRLAERSAFGALTVFHFESPKSCELGTEIEEAGLLQAACALSGHRFYSFRPVSDRDMTDQLHYIFKTWESPQGDRSKPQFSLHFSCHGSAEGIQIGRDFLQWQ
jgi:hypothetical protein